LGKLLDALFRKAGRTYGAARWVFKSLAGTEEEAIAAEYALGANLAREILAQMPVNDDPARTESIRNTGKRLSQRLRQKQRRFNFYILNTPEINAFALPGGFILITGLLLDFCEMNEAEIAFVLGHEMGHVVKGHALDRLVANSLIGVVANLSPGGGIVGGLTRKTLVKLLYSTYSQDQELEADLFGVRIMDAAGYDPKAAVSFMQRLKARRQDSSASKLEKYFSTHPEHAARLENLGQFFAP